jgi:hypothetical protein
MEIHMTPQRYTESQVLFGLREAWQDFTGVDDPFNADTRIDTYMKADGSWDELDFADIFRGIERFFDFNCSDKEWTDFFGFPVAERSLSEWEHAFAPHLTFGSLARFIADRAPAVASFDAISILGRPCLPAGVFTGIQRLAHKSMGKRRRFGPSTRIIDVMQGNDLDRFWSQLRWMTERSTPELSAFWRNVNSTTGCLGVLAVIASLIAAWGTSSPVWIVPTLLIATASYILALTYKRFTNPLPSHIVTFRDLSLLIATRRSYSKDAVSSLQPTNQ